MDIYKRLEEFEMFFIRATLPGGMRIDDYNRGMAKFAKLQIEYAKYLESLAGDNRAEIK